MAERFRNCVGPQVRRHRMGRGLTQDQLAARLQLAGLHHVDRVAVAKIESQIRSVHDYEVAVLADVLGVESRGLFPGASALAKELDDLISGKRA